MANTALNVTRTDASTNETLNQTLTDLNPAATNAQLKAFAQAFYGLSDDTYVDATRVDKTDVDTEESGGKQARNLTVTGLASNATANITFGITSGETTKPAVFYYANSTLQALTVTAGEGTDTQAVYTVTVPTVPQDNAVVYIGVAGSEYFDSAFLRETVTA